MSNHDSIHHSFWLRDQPLTQQFESLQSDHTTEVLIIGGGITGLSVALELLQAGRSVTVCEANVIGGGTTGGSSGHLDCHPEIGPAKLRQQTAEDTAAMLVDLRRKAIDLVEQRAGDECDFRRIPAYYYSEDPAAARDLDQQCAAAVKLGLSATSPATVPLRHAACGYRLGGMGRIDTGAYIQRLAHLVVQKGGTIFERSPVAGLTEDTPQSLEAGAGVVHFEQVVCATHCNFTDVLRLYAQTPAYQSYVCAVRVQDLIDDALYWDDQSPYFYIRRATSEDPHLILVGGCDHRTGEGCETQAIEQLHEYIRKRFQVEKIISTWSAELFEPTDGLPLIGKVPGHRNVWIATGLSGVGLTWGTAAGILIRDQMFGIRSAVTDALSPARFGIQGLGTMIGEQLTSAGNYAERILPAEDLSDRTLLPGQGAVGNLDGDFVAICRDREGCEHRHSPVCTHMGGVLHWNDAEQTWDCPVHGGRFAADGTRLYGPPEKDMQPVSQQPKSQA